MKWVPCFLFLLLPFLSNSEDQTSSSNPKNPFNITQWKCKDRQCKDVILNASATQLVIPHDGFSVQVPKGDKVNVLRISYSPTEVWFVKYKGKCGLVNPKVFKQLSSKPDNLENVDISDNGCPVEGIVGRNSSSEVNGTSSDSSGESETSNNSDSMPNNLAVGDSINFNPTPSSNPHKVSTNVEVEPPKEGQENQMNAHALYSGEKSVEVSTSEMSSSDYVGSDINHSVTRSALYQTSTSSQASASTSMPLTQNDAKETSVTPSPTESSLSQKNPSEPSIETKEDSENNFNTTDNHQVDKTGTQPLIGTDSSNSSLGEASKTGLSDGLTPGEKGSTASKPQAPESTPPPVIQNGPYGTSIAGSHLSESPSESSRESKEGPEQNFNTTDNNQTSEAGTQLSNGTDSSNSSSGVTFKIDQSDKLTPVTSSEKESTPTEPQAPESTTPPILQNGSNETSITGSHLLENSSDPSREVKDESKNNLNTTDNNQVDETETQPLVGTDSRDFNVWDPYKSVQSNRPSTMTPSEKESTSTEPQVPPEAAPPPVLQSDPYATSVADSYLSENSSESSREIKEGPEQNLNPSDNKQASQPGAQPPIGTDSSHSDFGDTFKMDQSEKPSTLTPTDTKEALGTTMTSRQTDPIDKTSDKVPVDDEDDEDMQATDNEDDTEVVDEDVEEGTEEESIVETSAEETHGNSYVSHGEPSEETPKEEANPPEVPSGYFDFVSSALESITSMFYKPSSPSEEVKDRDILEETITQEHVTDTTSSGFTEGDPGSLHGVPSHHQPPPPHPQEMEWLSMSQEKMAVMVFTALVVLIFSLGHYYIMKSNREEELIFKLNTTSKELQLILKERSTLEEKFSQIKTNASKLTTDSEKKGNLLSKLEKELQDSREENKDLISKIEKLEKEIEVLMDEGTQLHSLLSDAISDDVKETRLASDLSELKEDLSLALEKIEDLTKELETKTEEIHMLQLDLNNNIEKRQLLEGSLETKKKELEEKHVLEMKEVVEQLTQRQDVIEEKNLQITMLKSDFAGLQKKYDNLTVQYDVLEKSLQKAHGVDGSEILTEWLDSKNIRNAHQEALVEIQNLKKQLDLSQNDQMSLSEKLELKKNELSQLNEKYELAERDKIEALTKLQVLSNYFNEKETELQEQLGLKESMWLQKQSEDHSIYEQMRMLREENLNYKSQIETLKEEILDQEASFKIRISNEEKKTHENWVALRHSERRLKEIQMEAAQLRNRLTTLEANSDHNSEDKLSQSILEANGEFPPPPGPVSGLTSPSYLGYPGEFLPPPLHPLARPPPLGRISSPPIPADFTPPPPYLSPLSLGHSSVPPPPPASFTPPSPTVAPPLVKPQLRDPFPPDNSKEPRPSFNSTDSPGRRKDSRRNINSNV